MRFCFDDISILLFARLRCVRVCVCFLWVFPPAVHAVIQTPLKCHFCVEHAETPCADSGENGANFSWLLDVTYPKRPSGESRERRTEEKLSFWFIPLKNTSKTKQFTFNRVKVRNGRCTRLSLTLYCTERKEKRTRERILTSSLSSVIHNNFIMLASKTYSLALSSSLDNTARVCKIKIAS